MEALIPMGHWLWGVIAVLCLVPVTLFYGVPFIRRARRKSTHSEPPATVSELRFLQQGQRLARAQQRLTDGRLRVLEESDGE